MPPHNTTSLNSELETKIRDTIAELESVKGTIHIDTEDTTAGEVSLVKVLTNHIQNLIIGITTFRISFRSLRRQLLYRLTHLSYSSQQPLRYTQKKHTKIHTKTGILWNNREDRDKSEIYLKRAEQLYFNWKKGQNTDNTASLQSLQEYLNKNNVF